MTTIPSHVLHQVVEEACRAPSVHNTQPWRWVETARGLELHSDPRRRLMYADRDGRDQVVSCGAVLHGVTVAGAAHGWRTVVDRVPDPYRSSLLADVRFRPHSPTKRDAELAAAAATRRTDRRAVAAWPVPDDRIESLRRIASSHGCVLTTLPAPDGRALAKDLMLSAMREQHHSQAYLDELLAWTSSDDRLVGVPPAQQLDRDAAHRLLDVPTRFPSGRLPDAADDAVPPEDRHESWLVLSTSSDDTLSWLRTGEALLATWLDCVTHRLSLVPFSQPVEVEETRMLLRESALDGASSPQLLLRVGWPQIAVDPVDLTPRLPVTSVLERREARRV
jgi:hypothetical protein